MKQTRRSVKLFACLGELDEREEDVLVLRGRQPILARSAVMVSFRLMSCPFRSS